MVNATLNVAMALLVAFALFLAPVASAQAMSCHGHTPHEHLVLAHPSVLTLGDRAFLQGGLHNCDHKSCCVTPCSFSLALICSDRADVAAIAASSFLRFAWVDQTGSGLALPPALDPPRLPV
jgi:hypothetical protein